MNMCTNCHNPLPCGCGCKPASYKCDFDIMANPYDNSIWNVTINGATKRVKIPKTNETDTKLSTSYSGASLNFNAERHTDIVTGSQLGSLINLKDLRDVDAENADSFDILVHHPYCDECGDGCTPKEAKWEKYHIPDEQSNVLEPDDDGYYHVLTLTDCGGIKGARIQKPSMDEELTCRFNNLLNAIAPFSGEGRMIDVEAGGSTLDFGGGLDPNTGEFNITWKDWDIGTVQVAHGEVTGKLNATSSFDYETGKVKYTITSIYYDKVVYTVDRTASLQDPMTTTIWGCFPGTHDLKASHADLTAAGLKIFERPVVVREGNSYTQTIGVTFDGNYTIELDPNGGTSAWIDVMRLYNDWTHGDDDGVDQVRYINPLRWESC